MVAWHGTQNVLKYHYQDSHGSKHFGYESPFESINDFRKIGQCLLSCTAVQPIVIFGLKYTISLQNYNLG